MISYQPPKIDSVPIIDAVNVLSSVDPESEAVQAARALGISFGDMTEGECPFGTTGAVEDTGEIGHRLEAVEAVLDEAVAG